MDNYEEFKKKVLTLTSIDLSSYKERQMKRRIDTLIAKSGAKSYDDYVTKLRTDKTVLEAFVNYLTINVSEFYRNPEQWKTLESEVLPFIFNKFGKKIKIWSAACSTGDEPYTLVMLLAEYIPMKDIKIVATDIDKQVLEKAQMGIYDSKSLKGLPQKYIDKYFTKITDRSYQISEEVKRCVEFSNHNLLLDPYPTNCEMIVCRNVLIYFTDEAKREIYKKFCQSLKPEGILFVGSTEQIIGPKELGFSTRHSFFYNKL